MALSWEFELSEYFPVYHMISRVWCVDDSVIPLTVNFFAEHSGRYVCRIILRGGEHTGRGAGNQLSAGDVRMFQICCIVSPQGNKATIDFVSPVSIPVVQNIPVVSRLFSGGTVCPEIRCCKMLSHCSACLQNVFEQLCFDRLDLALVLGVFLFI